MRFTGKSTIKKGKPQNVDSRRVFNTCHFQDIEEISVTKDNYSAIFYGVATVKIEDYQVKTKNGPKEMVSLNLYDKGEYILSINMTNSQFNNFDGGKVIKEDSEYQIFFGGNLYFKAYSQFSFSAIFLVNHPTSLVSLLITSVPRNYIQFEDFMTQRVASYE